MRPERVWRQVAPERRTMSIGRGAVVSLALVLAVPVTHADERVWPSASAGELSVFVTLLRFQIYEEHCSSGVPKLKPEFEIRVQGLARRIQAISIGLLGSEEFRGIRDRPVPVEIVDAFKDSFHDTQHNFERRDAASICPETLQRLDVVSDESLKTGLTEVLTAVRNMMRNLDQAGDRQVSPAIGSAGA